MEKDTTLKQMDEKTALKQMERLSVLSKNMRLAAESWDSEFQILVSIILSARTLDETTIRVGTLLFQKYPTANALSQAPLEDVEKIISPINFYQNKARYIIECAKTLVEKYGGKPPHYIDALTSLSGVGRKTANVFLSEVGNEGIGVDTHLSYISQKLEWTKNTKPEKIEEDLKNLFARENWNKVNPTAVRFGKTYTNRQEKDKLLEKIKKIK